MCLITGVGRGSGAATVSWGCVFDLEIIAGNGLVLVISFVGVAIGLKNWTCAGLGQLGESTSYGTELDHVL